MLKALLTFAFFFCFQTAVWGQSVINDISPGDPEIFLIVDNGGNRFFDLFVRPNGGSLTAPNQVYVPIGTDTTSSNTDNRNYNYYANRAFLPLLTGEVPDQTTTMRFRLNVNVEGTDDQIYAAVGTGTSYEIVKANTQTVDNSDLIYEITLNEICAPASIDCSQLEKSDAPTTSITSNLFIFLSTGRGTGQTLDPASLDNGVTYELNLSNRIYTTEFQLFDLFKGDGQLTADYRAFTMVNPRGIYGIVEKGSQGLCSGDVSGATSDQLLGDGAVNKSFADLVDLESTETIGQVKVKNLENDFCYSVRLTFCDLYGFCSRVSKGIQNTPEDIQALLEGQACFFFTAGFGEEHPVVNYFQAWRDNTLKKTWLGRRFIDFYYDVAPQYTPFILERPWLQKVIRGIAYLLYGVMKGWPAILFLLMLAVVQFRLRKKVI